jgi:hypothetical protein
MTGQSKQSGTLSGVTAALGELLDAEVKLGADLFRTFTGTNLPNLNAGDLLRSARRATRSVSPGCCTIPPPCWLPQPLGECTSHVGQCRSACIDMVITNCDGQAHAVAVEVSKTAAKVTVEPAKLELGPLERATVSVCLEVPKDAADGTRYELLVRVYGCREYYLRWTVSVGTLGLDSCHEVAVDDCPDYLHHWYDHFYCGRRCSSAQREVGVAANG